MFRWTRAASTGWLGLYCQPRPVLAEVADARPSNQQPFGAEESPLELEIPAKSAELSGGSYHPMARYVALAAVAHDVAHRACRSRASGRFSDVAVGRDLPDRNATNHGQDSVSERSGRHNLNFRIAPVFPLPPEALRP